MQVSACLYHKSWEARVAAGEAIGLLADAFPHATAADLEQHCLACGGGSLAAEGDAGAGGAPGATAYAVTFQDFNLRQILDKGQPLLASGGQVGFSMTVAFPIDLIS